LFDNATRFSPPDTAVVAEGRRIGDYVLIQIEDRGLGMAPEQMNQLNERLAEPPTVDVAAFRMMGLAVVSRLASRYRIKVELRPNPEGGTITSVTLPTGVLVLPRLRGREPVITRPRAPLAVEQAAPAGPPPGNGPTAGGPPLAPASARPYVSGGGDQPPYVPAGAQPPPVPPEHRPEEGSWRTSADLGWQAAAKAAEPQNAGTTRSGL